MAENFFDQFDEAAPAKAAKPATPAADANFFDQFDEGGAPSDRASGAPNAFARGLVDGVPVVGPYLLSGIDKADAAVRSLTGDTRYSDEAAKAESYGRRMASEHSWANTAGEIAGGVVGTAPLVAAAPAAFGVSAAALPVRAGFSMATNGALGAADAAVRSDGDVRDTITGGLIGVFVGGAAPYAGHAAGKVASSIASKISPAAPVATTPELKAAARAAYQRADDAGVQVAPPTFAAAVDDMARVAKEAGIDPTIHPEATAAVGRLKEAAGTAPTLKDIEILRRVVKGVGGPLAPDEQRIASMLVDKIDEFTGGLKADDLISGDAATAVDALSEARGLWSRARRAETIENAVTRAEDRAASTGSGGNADNAIRQNLRAILDNPKKLAGFTPNEVHFIRSVVRGTPVQNALRLVGKLSPSGNGLMAALGLAGAVMEPMSAAIPAAGLVAKKLSDGTTARRAARLAETVRNGGAVPASPLMLSSQKAAERLVPFGFSQIPLAANRARQ